MTDTKRCNHDRYRNWVSGRQQRRRMIIFARAPSCRTRAVVVCVALGEDVDAGFIDEGGRDEESKS